MSLSTNFYLGPAAADLILNGLYRGQAVTPPTEMWLSIGTGADLRSVTELAGATRVVLKCNLGEIRGTDSTSYPYPSSGTGTSGFFWGRGIYVPVPTGMPVDYTGNTYLMAFTASTGGSLYFVGRATSNSSFHPQSAMTTLNPRDVLWFTSLIGAQGAGLPAYMYAIFVDFVFRGRNTFTELINLTSYPNLYMSFGWTNSAIQATPGYGTTYGYWSGMPWMTIPRNTTTWGAPTTYTSGTTSLRKITNLVTLTTNPATVASADSGYHGGYALYAIHQGNTAQAFDDTFYMINGPQSSLQWNVGDQISFAPGQLEIVIG